MSTLVDVLVAVVVVVVVLPFVTVFDSPELSPLSELSPPPESSWSVTVDTGLITVVRCASGVVVEVVGETTSSVLDVETVGTETFGFGTINVTNRDWLPTWSADGTCAALPPVPATVTKAVAAAATISEPSHRPHREWESEDLGPSRRTLVSAAFRAASSA
ncbi:MAG TPA: hypothetical protein VII67_06830 [Acidimicrobiales bacterium]